MRRYLSMILILMACIPMHAQKVNFSQVIEQKENEQTHFMGASEAGVCLVTEKVVSEDKTEVYLELFTGNLKPVGTFEVAAELQVRGKLDVADAKVVGSKIFLFIYFQPLGESSVQLHLYKYDFKGFPAGKPNMLFEFSDPKLNLATQASATEITFSADSSQFLLQFPTSLPKTEVNRSYHVYVVGIDGYMQWEETLKVSQEANYDMRAKPALIDRNGNLFMTALRCPDPGQKNRIVRTIYKYDATDLRWSSVDFNLGELVTVPAAFCLNDKGNIVFVAPFGVQGSNKNQHMIFWEISTSNMKVVQEKYSELQGLFPAVANEKALTAFTIRQLTFLPSGGYLLIAEQKSSKVANPTTNEITYMADNILAVRLDAKGQVLWSTLVGKRQVTNGYGGALNGFMPFLREGKLCLIFNDQPENVATIGFLTNPKVMRGTVESGTAFVTVDMETHVGEKKVLIPAVEDNILPLASKFAVVSGNEVYFLARFQNTYKVGKVSF